MKVIFFVNAWALAHVSRAIEISKSLEKRGHKILIAGAGDYLEFARKSGFETQEISGPTSEDLQEVYDTGNIKTIVAYSRMQEDLDSSYDLCKIWKPDLIVSDNRIVSRTAGDILDLPVVSIMNAHITNYQKLPFISWPDKLSFLPLPLRQWLMTLQVKIERKLMDNQIFFALKQLRNEFKLKPLYSFEHEHGHLTLLPDIEKFNPTTKLPENVKYIGPLTWKSDLPPPKALNEIDPNIPTIYFALGSHALSMSSELLGLLGQLPYQFILSLGHSDQKLEHKLPKNFFVEGLVNSDLVLPHCQAVICHGGNGTIYQALAYGLPIIGIPRHPEQAQGVKQLVRLGLGIQISNNFMEKNNGKELVKAIKKIMNNSSYNKKAQNMQQLIAKTKAPEQACDYIEDFMKDKVIEPTLSEENGKALMR